MDYLTVLTINTLIFSSLILTQNDIPKFSPDIKGIEIVIFSLVVLQLFLSTIGILNHNFNY